MNRITVSIDTGHQACDAQNIVVGLPPHSAIFLYLHV
jgi:hypothetical protein